MAGSGKLPFRARLTIILISIIVFFFYFLIQGNQGDVQQVSIQGRFLYSAFGEFGNAYVYEMRQARPLPLVVPPTAGQLTKIHRLVEPLDKSQRRIPFAIGQISTQSGDLSEIVAQGDQLYAVDPTNGFTIFDNRDQNAPQLLAHMEFYGIQDLAVFENLVFIAAGVNGIYLLDVSNPVTPLIIDHYDTPGVAERILPVLIQFNIGDFQVQTEEVKLAQEKPSRYMAYVADGESGLILVDFISSQPALSKFIVFKEINTPGYAYDVYYKDAYLFVADGFQGLHIFNALINGDDPTNPRHLGSLDTPGEARQVLFYRDYLIVADSEAGLFTARFINRGDSLEIVTTNNLPVPSGVFHLAVNKDLAVLASGVQGTQIVNIANPSRPYLQSRLPTPGIATSKQILAAILGESRDGDKVWGSIRDMIKEFSFAGILLVVWMLFLSLFALPYSSARGFWRSADNFLTYLLGNMGRTVMVEDGQLLADPALQDYSKNRPLILDNASAGLLMNQEGNMRVVGPGTDMLQPGEALVKTADLRLNAIIFGPADEDPFQSQQIAEDEIEFRQRLRRRVQTSAETRDGVEIVPNIIVEYHIKGDTDPFRNPFGFHPAYALQALRQDYAADKANVESESDSDLNRLPAELAVQAWRTSLKLFDLQSLFSPLGGKDLLSPPRASYGLQQVIATVNRSLTQQYVEEISEFGLPTGNQLLSEAYNELEHAGLEVKRAWIVNLRIDPEHEAKFLKRWIEAWPGQIQQASAALEARYQEVEGVNHQRAMFDFVRAAIGPLREGMLRYRALPEQFLFLNRSLHLLACGTRSLGSLGPAERLKLDQMIDWLERNLEL